LDLKCNGLDEYPLSYYCIVIGGGTPKTSVPEYWGGNIPWISIKDIVESNNIIENTEKTITEEGLNNSSTKILDKGDIIISARGTVGKIALISKPMAFNQSCFGIKVNRNVDPVFFYYVLVNSISTIKKNTQGSVFDTITAKTFDSIRIAMPTFEVQRRIGSFLSSIDSQINANMRINDYLAA
jgi:type I restriction enzyme S subunit